MAALFLGCFFVMGCENDIKKVDNLTKKRPSTIEEAREIESYMSEAGKTKAKLVAALMLRNIDSTYMEFPEKLHVDFYNDSTVVESTLDAMYAKYFESQKTIFLRDSVRVINLVTGDTLKSRELWWDQNKQEFYTDKPAEVHQRNGNTLYHRNGLRAAQDLSWRETYGNSGRVNASEDGLK